MLLYRVLSITISNPAALKIAPPEAPSPPLPSAPGGPAPVAPRPPTPPAPALLRAIVEAVTDSVP